MSLADVFDYSLDKFKLVLARASQDGIDDSLKKAVCNYSLDRFELVLARASQAGIDHAFSYFLTTSSYIYNKEKARDKCELLLARASQAEIDQALSCSKGFIFICCEKEKELDFREKAQDMTKLLLARASQARIDQDLSHCLEKMQLVKQMSSQAFTRDWWNSQDSVLYNGSLGNFRLFLQRASQVWIARALSQPVRPLNVIARAFQRVRPLDVDEFRLVAARASQNVIAMTLGAMTNTLSSEYTGLLLERLTPCPPNIQDYC